MKASIITIGDELLIGQTINTNASWLGQQLTELGVDVVHCATIQDNKEAIRKALDHLLSISELVIISGGLGPTNDDITKYTLAEYFDSTLEINERILERVRSFFEKRSRTMLDVNILQAELPVDAIVLDNLVGTASGMWFNAPVDKVVVSLPGVPYEMKHIVTNEVLPRLESKYGLSPTYKKTIYFQGIGESYLAEEIKDVEQKLDSLGIKLAYLPAPGSVRLRFNGTFKDEPEVENAISEIRTRLSEYLYSETEQDLSVVVGDLLKSNGLTVGTVESCTGGALAGEIVKTPGSSAYFQGGFLTYSNELKNKLVGVSLESLNKHGAVSEEVATQMAQNGRKQLGVDYCISVTGIAGPNGATENKKVGLVYIAIAGIQDVSVFCFQFGDNRSRNIRTSVLSALNLLRREIIKNN